MSDEFRPISRREYSKHKECAKKAMLYLAKNKDESSKVYVRL